MNGRSILLILILSTLGLFSCKQTEQQDVVLPISNKAIYDTSSVWFGHFDRYPVDLAKLPIGIITSKVEELYVLEKFLTSDYFDNITGEEHPDQIYDFAGEKFQILLDYANIPYCDFYRDIAGINLLRDITVRNALHLMGEDYYIIPDDFIPTGVQDPIKMLINVTDASCLYCQEDLDTLMELSGTGVKSLNLISSAVKAAVKVYESGTGCAIGVLASNDLYQNSRFEAMIRKAFLEYGLHEKVQIFQQFAPGIEESIKGEEGYILPSAVSIREDYKGPVMGTGEDDIDINLMDRYGFQTSQNNLLVSYSKKSFSEIQLNAPENYARFYLVSLIEKHRRSGSRIPLKVIILGNMCDAFVLDTLKTVVAELYNFSRDGQYIYRNSISPDLVFVDPAECLVKDCYNMLRKDRKLAFNTSRTEVTSFLTIPSPSLDSAMVDTLTGAFSQSFKFNRVPGQEASGEKMIPFSLRYVKPESFRFASELYPESIRQIQKKLY